MGEAKVIRAEDRGVLEVGGPDRRAFLQGLVSNDVDKASATKAIYAALLTPQGRYLHDFFIVERGETLLLETERARLPDLLKKLSLYKLRSKVTVSDASAQWTVALAYGDDASVRLGLTSGDAGAAAAIDGGIAYVDPRLPALGVRALLPSGDGLEPILRRGLVEGPGEEWDDLRLSLGVPDGSRDLPVEKAILLENGFDELHGIDWQKGCYMGQELTARTRYRGLVRKRLLPVEVEGDDVEPGTPVMLDGKEAGEIRSARNGRALALLRLEMVDQARAAGKAMTAGGATIRPLVPDWMRLPEAAASE